MRFKNLFITGFGIFDESLPPQKRFFQFENPGINLVLGRNERGKSTLMEALLDTIYGIPGIRRDLRKPWGPARDYGARLELETGDKTLRIQRDFSTEEATITDITGGGSRVIFAGNANPRSRGGQARLYRETLGSMGIPSREVMEQLSFIRKMEMESGISDEIRRLVTGGGGINYHRVISCLTGKYFTISRENPWQGVNKNRPRELENLKLRLDEMEGRLWEINQSQAQLMNLEKEKETLQIKIEELQHRWEKNRFLHKTLTGALELYNEIRRNREDLTSALEERDRLCHRHQRRAEIEEELSRLRDVFDGVDEPILELCRELPLVEGKLEELKNRQQDRREEQNGMKSLRDRLEEDLYNNYAEIVLLPSNFPDLVEENRRLKEQLQEGEDFYNRQLSIVRQLEEAQNKKEDFALRGGRFEQQLESYIHVRDKILMELEFLDQKIQDRREAQEDISSSWNRVRKKYPHMDQLPEDLPSKLREYRDLIRNRELKTARLEEKEVEYRKLLRRIQSPVNFVPVVAGLLMGLILGLLFPDKIIAGAMGAIFGTVIGGVMAWRRLQELQVGKGRLEEAMDELQLQVSSPLPVLDIPDEFNDPGGLDRLADLFRDYQAAVRSIEKLTVKTAAIEPEDVLMRRRDALVLKLETAREETGLQPQEDPLKLLEEYRAYIRQQDRLVDLVDAIRSRFPSTVRDSLPPVPRELQDMKDRILQFERDYPLARGMPPFETLQDQFREMLVLKGKINEQETLIAHGESRDPLGPRIQQEQKHRDEILGVLTPLMDALGLDGPEEIEEKFNRCQLLSEQLRSFTPGTEEEGRREKLEQEIRDLSLASVVLQTRQEELAGKMPAVDSFLDMTPPRQRERLDELSRESDNLERELLSARERYNYVRVKIEESSPCGDPETLQEEMEDLRGRIRRLEIMRDGYRTAVDLLRESVEHFQRSHRSRIQDEISRIFSRLTGGRYGGVQLDSDFNITLMDSTGTPVEKQAISTGARDQLYLSVRMALARSLSDQVCLPFLLDDPLSSFDRERLLTARQILTELAGEHQVIIFTHNREFTGWGSLVQDLDFLGA